MYRSRSDWKTRLSGLPAAETSQPESGLVASSKKKDKCFFFNKHFGVIFSTFIQWQVKVSVPCLGVFFQFQLQCLGWV